MVILISIINNLSSFYSLRSFRRFEEREKWNRTIGKRKEGLALTWNISRIWEEGEGNGLIFFLPLFKSLFAIF